METPKKFLKSKPRETPFREGWSYKGKKCPKHKIPFLDYSFECEGEPMWMCKKCEDIYDEAFAKWFRKFGHIVACGSDMFLPGIVENGRIKRITPGLVFMQYLHGEKPIKIGSFCKLDKNGFIRKCNRPKTFDNDKNIMLVVD